MNHILTSTATGNKMFFAVKIFQFLTHFLPKYVRLKLFFRLFGFFLMVCFHATLLNILWLFSLLKSLGAPDKMLECTDFCFFFYFKL
jgi:hypothetical protein